MQPEFIGENIYIRPLEKKDLILRPQWFNDPEINRTLLIELPISFEGTKRWFKRILPQQNISRVDLSICDKKTNEVIGMTGLLNINKTHLHSQFYMTIGNKEYWGKHLPDEVIPIVLWLAFKIYNLNKVYLWTIDSNERARRVYERNHFKKEGVLREHLFSRGKIKDIHQHSILKKDWKKFYEVKK
jgi:diamine N-acetyltransferase